MKIKILVFLILLLCYGCKNYQSVDFKKPYLKIDKNFFDQLKIEMHDYDTKEHVDIKTHGIQEHYVSFLNKYTNDYIIAARFECDILLVHSDSSSRKINACEPINIKNAVLSLMHINKDYIVVHYNIGFTDKMNGYTYGLGVFNHEFKLIEYIEKQGFIWATGLFDDKLIYNYGATSLPEEDEQFEIVEYNIRTREEKSSKHNFPNKKFFIKVKNHLYAGDDVANCDISLDGKKLKNNWNNVRDYCFTMSVFNYQGINNKTVIPLKSSLKSDSYFLEIDNNDPENVTITTDNICSNFEWYSSQGKYCRDKKEEGIYFNDFKNNPIKLDIDAKSSHEFGFYDWS